MKRVISFFTALSMTLMLFTSMPISVSANDSETHAHDMSVSCGGSGVEFQPYHSGSPGPGNYYLTGNVSHVAIWRINTPGVYNLCLNGYSINPARIEIEENVTFNLCDCKGTGSITSFSDPGIYGLHGVDGEFNMYGGKLIGSGRADRQERGVSIVGNGKFTMYAGEITGYNGEDMGGVAVSGNGTFIMNGGKITNNTVQSEAAGAGVRSYGADSTVIINGGEISGNHGFGVEAWGRIEINGGKIINNQGGAMVNKMTYISGSPVIKNNYYKDKPFNLSLSNKLYLSGRLGDGAEIGIAACDSSRIFTNNWNDVMGDADPADYFTSDSDITKVKRYSDEGALCVLLTLDADGIKDIVGDIPEPAYYPWFMDVIPLLPTDLKRKGYLFKGWCDRPNSSSYTIEYLMKKDSTLYPAFEACKYHSKLRIFKVDPTCTKDGFEEYVLCEKCGLTFSPSSWSELFEPKAIPALSHDFGDWTTVEEATCTADGIKERVCKRNKCGQKETDIIPKTEHDFGTDYEKNETQHWQVCAVCSTESKKSNHTWNDGEITVPPSETAEGVITYRCTVCGAEKTEKTDNPEHTHTFSPDWTSDDTHHWHAATCEHTDEVDGRAEHTFFEGKCTVCQKSDPNYSQPTDTEPIVTEPPVTEPPVMETTVTAPSVTVQREPFLQDENGKIGWDVISDDIWETPDGETVLVNMNGTTELPKNIVSDIAGRDIDLVLIMNDGFVWTINGMSVTKARTVNMSVRKLSKIPESTVRKFFGDLNTVQLDLRHNGDFGFTATLTLDIGIRFSGMYANSYRYKSRNFEFGDSSEIVNGQAKLRFTHASSWLITVEDFPVVEDVSSSAAAHSAGAPIDMSNSTSGGITVPEFDEKKMLRLSGKKRRYRILKKRRLNDLVFVL